jgi:hypothetical protein
VLVEYGVSASGSVMHPRVVYAMPSGLFDEVSKKGLGTIRYSPATRGGKAMACRGLYKPIIWKVEEGPGLTVPFLAPQAKGITT